MLNLLCYFFYVASYIPLFFIHLNLLNM